MRHRALDSNRVQTGCISRSSFCCCCCCVEYISTTERMKRNFVLRTCESIYSEVKILSTFQMCVCYLEDTLSLEHLSSFISLAFEWTHHLLRALKLFKYWINLWSAGRKLIKKKREKVDHSTKSISFTSLKFRFLNFCASALQRVCVHWRFAIFIWSF